jgi:hypothetical protein
LLRLAVVFGINAHVVGQSSVKAEVFEADLVLAHFQLLLPVSTQTFRRAADTDAFVK